MADALGFAPDAAIRCRDYRIGCIGAGFIMADVHLAAYREAGFPVVAIASRTPDKAAEVAKRWGIGRVHDTPEALIEDPEVEIVDIAFPPDQQPALIRHALRQPHVKAILAQKPLALDFETPRRVADEANAAAGKVLSVNQNMRFDQSMRVLKQLLDRGELGEPVIATIEMRAIPHWQPFLQRLRPADAAQHEHPPPGRAALPVRRPDRDLHRRPPGPAHGLRPHRRHHRLDAASSRPACSPSRWRTSGPARARRASSPTSTSTGGSRAPRGSRRARSAGPTTRPAARRRCATARRRATGGEWVEPSWDTMWFPHAFMGVMDQLQDALNDGTRAGSSGATMSGPWRWSRPATARSKEDRPVKLAEFGY